MSHIIKYVIPPQQKKDMIMQAIEKHHRIYKCPIKRIEMMNATANDIEGLWDGFRVSGNEAHFWFNDENKSTHVIRERIVCAVQLEGVEN